ncbi:MAG: neutral/alkaline non-lysosomal ceramidase N-terminal domain-containing protein [Pirellulaceae bacterium]|nr:neutral/alkaline non-lysosomal ceramidase N-terminal domain-containing protein [Pirellulaceae bacterium]
MNVAHRLVGLLVVICLSLGPGSHKSLAADMQVGFAKVDITPTQPTPMWGYGARHAALSTGVRDPLLAKAVVFEAGRKKLAMVGVDLGRSPTDAMMTRIRAAVLDKAGVQWLLISGSHTHHGPVIELLDEPGKGRGAFDAAVAYAQKLEQKIIDVIVAAAADLKPATIGWGSKPVGLNRNRHSKLEPKPVDNELSVIRLDDLQGRTIALVVHYAAHATLLDAADLRFSADWPGQMTSAVEQQLGTNCVFMQGAAGDLSPNPPPEKRRIEDFGQALAAEVVSVSATIQTKSNTRPRLDAREEVFDFPTRLPMSNPVTQLVFGQAFFAELAAASISEDLMHNRIRPTLTTVLINRELAIVGGSGEFFCQHSLRLKERSRADKTLLFGYCNGHHMYFPTIEGAAEGGYGADAAVSWVSVGAGEEMMNQALIAIYTMLGKL